MTMDESVEGRGGLEPVRSHDAWARLRFSIVGRLLAAPPARGDLHREIAELAAKTWRHPITGEPTRFGRSTIERWYYQARSARTDPVAKLRRRARKDAGQQQTIGERLKVALRAQIRRRHLRRALAGRRLPWAKALRPRGGPRGAREDLRPAR